MVTATGTGFDGTVNEQQWASLASFFAPPCARTTADWKIGVTGADRTVRAAAGEFYADGVNSTLSGFSDTLALPATSGATKWWTILLHIDWTAPGGGASTLTYAGGGTSKTINLGADTTPGLKCNYALALVPVTSSNGPLSAGVIVDLRDTLGEVRRGWKNEWVDIPHSASWVDDPARGHTAAYRSSCPAGRVELRGCLAAADGTIGSTGGVSGALVGNPLESWAWPNRPQPYQTATSTANGARVRMSTSGQIEMGSVDNPETVSFDGWVYDTT